MKRLVSVSHNSLASSRLYLLGLFAVLMPAFGCGSGVKDIPPAAAIVYPSVTGNWQIQTNAGTPSLGVLLTGSLTQTNSTVTGTVQYVDLIPGNACPSTPSLLNVSGTVDTNGMMTLATAQGSNGVALSTQLQISSGAYGYAYGTLAVTAPSGCSYTSSPVLGVHVGDVTGSYSGNPALTGAILGVGLSSAKLTLTQSPTSNADGTYGVSGNLVFGGSACGANVPVQGFISGVGVALSSPSNNGALPEVQISGTANPDRSGFYDATFTFNSGGCSASSAAFATYSGTLKRDS